MARTSTSSAKSILFESVKEIVSALENRNLQVSHPEYEYVLSKLISSAIPKVNKLDMSNLVKLQKMVVNELSKFFTEIGNKTRIDPEKRKVFDELRIAEKLITSAKEVRKSSYRKADVPMERNVVEHGVFSVSTSQNVSKTKINSGISNAPTYVRKTKRRFMELRNASGAGLTMFDCKLMLGLQKLWEEQRTNKVRFTFYEIAKLLGMEISGPNYRIIEESLLNLYRTEVVLGDYREREGADSIRIEYDRLLYKISEVLGSFEKRFDNDVVEVEFSENLYKSLENGYVMYLNLNIFNDLTSPTAQGLYMLFCSDLNTKRWSISEVSDYLGLNANRPAKVIDYLLNACEQLKEIGVIDDFTFDIPSNRKAEKYLEVVYGQLLTSSQKSGGVLIDNNQLV